MIQIRNNVFETNSSSSHSISFSSRDSSLKENCMLIDDDGYIHAKFGEFGWEIKDYYDQANKLSYLLTMAAALNGIYVYNYFCEDGEQEDAINEFIETEDFKKISDEIAGYAHCNGIVMDYSKGYIDHQSYENYINLDDFLDWNNTNILDFVFGNVIVHTDNDNH